MNQFSERRLIEFGNDPPHLGVVAQRVDPFQDFSQEALADLGNPLFCVPITNGLESTLLPFTPAAPT